MTSGQPAPAPPSAGDILSVRFASDQTADCIGTVLDSDIYHREGKYKGYCTVPPSRDLVRVVSGQTARPDGGGVLSPSEFLVYFAEDGEVWRLCAKTHQPMFTVERATSKQAPCRSKRQRRRESSNAYGPPLVLPNQSVSPQIADLAPEIGDYVEVDRRYAIDGGSGTVVSINARGLYRVKYLAGSSESNLKRQAITIVARGSPPPRSDPEVDEKLER